MASIPAYTNATDRENMQPRVLARIDVRQNRAIKPVRYDGLKDVGDPNELAHRYIDAGCDEIVFLDAVASLFRTQNLQDRLRDFRRGVNRPIAAGGGIRSCEDALGLLRAGADKVVINTHAVARPRTLTEISNAIGAQSCCLLIEAKLVGEGSYSVTTNGATQIEAMDVVAWATRGRALGVGEILIVNVDHDGTRGGLDLQLAASVAAAVDCPVIASGGFSGTKVPYEDLVTSDISGIAIGTSLHRGEVDVNSVRSSWSELARQNRQ